MADELAGGQLLSEMHEHRLSTPLPILTKGSICLVQVSEVYIDHYLWTGSAR